MRSVVLWNSRRFGLEVHAIFCVMLALMGIIGAVVAPVIVSQHGGRVGWAWVLGGFGVGAATAAGTVLAHEAAHAIGIRATGYRGQIVMFLGQGGETGPVYFGGRAKAIVALAGPGVDLLTAAALSAAWATWDAGARGVVLGVAWTVVLTVFAASFAAEPNDFAIAKDAWNQATENAKK